MDFKNIQVAAICAFNGNLFDAQQMERKEDMEYEMKMMKYVKEKEEYNEAMRKYELQMEEYIKANPDATMVDVANIAKNTHDMISRPASPIPQKRAINPHTMIPEGLEVSFKSENKKANLITRLFGL